MTSSTYDTYSSAGPSSSTIKLAPRRRPPSSQVYRDAKPNCDSSTVCEDPFRLKVPLSFERASSVLDCNGRPALLLKVQRPPGSSCHLPVVNEGQPIVGNVELNFSKPEYVEEITISVKGSLVGHSRNPKRFVEVSECLWKMDKLGQVTCAHFGDGSLSAQLKGYFNWPFSLTLPSHVAATDRRCQLSNNQYFGQLPPSFSISDFRTSISYELVVTVKMRNSLSLTMPFMYAPLSRPPCMRHPGAPNHAREDTWEVCKSFVVRGIAFGAYNVDVTCTLALAKPLMYTRGQSIRCILVLESNDAKTIELLGKARAPAAVVRLCRVVEDASPGLEVKLARLLDAIRPPCTFVSEAGWRVAGAADMEDEGIKAIAGSLREGLRAKILIGEIPLPADMTPSFAFAKLSLKYEVQVLPFAATGFVAEAGDKAIFFRTLVQVASDSALPALEETYPSRLHTPPPVPLRRDTMFLPRTRSLRHMKSDSKLRTGAADALRTLHGRSSSTTATVRLVRERGLPPLPRRPNCMVE